MIDVSIRSEGRTLFTKELKKESSIEKEEAFSVKGLPLRMKIGLTKEFYDRLSVSPQKMFLISGILFSLFFSLATYLAELYRENNRQLILASHTRSIFLKNVNHELRTPLHGIVGALSLLEKNNFSSNLSKTKRRLGIIYLSAKKLQRLLNNLLGVTMLETETFNIILEHCNINQIVNDLLPPFKKEAHNKKIQLTVSIEDPVRKSYLVALYPLSLIIANLLDNAIRFTTSGGVTLTINIQELTEERGNLHLEVKDTGCGLTSETKEHLFQQASPIFLGVNLIGSGAKTGLYLARALLDKMHGSIRFDTIEGEGSTFYVDIPVAFAKEPAAPRWAG